MFDFSMAYYLDVKSKVIMQLLRMLVLRNMTSEPKFSSSNQNMFCLYLPKCRIFAVKIEPWLLDETFLSTNTENLLPITLNVRSQSDD